MYNLWIGLLKSPIHTLIISGVIVILFTILNEDKRTELITQGKQGKKEKDGKTRFQKRTKSSVKSNVRQLNRIDFNQLFKDNILTVTLEVRGETNDYDVTISFGGFLDELHRQLRYSNNKLELRVVIKALVNTFNSDNIYFRCTCPDFIYRHNYWASKKDLVVGQKETRPSDITNPYNDLGPACKHILLILSNYSWLIKLASVVYNYVNYMEKHYQKMYADIIYPAIYEKKYEEPVQLDIETLDKVDLDTDAETVDRSNVYARDKNKFKPGNKQGIRFAKKEDRDSNMPLLNRNKQKSDEIEDTENNDGESN